MAMQVVHKDCVAVLIRPRITKIDHRAAVSVASTRFVFSLSADSCVKVKIYPAKEEK
jgi:hypothetical protein